MGRRRLQLPEDLQGPLEEALPDQQLRHRPGHRCGVPLFLFRLLAVASGVCGAVPFHIPLRRGSRRASFN